jgi:hypothetical protein
MIPKGGGSSMSRFRQGELTKVRNYNYSFVKSNLRNETTYRTPEFISPPPPIIPVETESKSDDLQLLAPPPFGKSSNRILECIALNTTTKEIVNGRFDTFMNRLLERTVATDTTRSITLYIILNNSLQIEVAKEWIPKLAHIFKTISVISLDIAAIDDLYSMTPKKDEACGKYGFISGPYCLFMGTMKCCETYNTTLLLETDCILNEHWVDSLYYYTKHAGGFWISGATYDGRFHDIWRYRSMFAHLNGVALYATGNSDFQAFLKLFEEFYARCIKSNSQILGYDTSMRHILDHHLEKQPSEYYWRFAERQMLRNCLIINCSCTEDSNMTKEINKLYDYAILHIK